MNNLYTCPFCNTTIRDGVEYLIKHQDSGHCDAGMDARAKAKLAINKIVTEN